MVGSRHEGRGEKGMAHLLEHMVFKGTDKYENIWGALEDHGANFNGTTWVDRTNYFETLPANDENLEFALSMEADRMVNSRIAAEDLAKEFSVVRNEFEMGENDPIGVLMERIDSAAYLWHNYGQSTIGNRSDIERVPADNLKRFYEKYYQPDNAMLVVAGKFEEARALELIQQYFGSIPRPQRELEASYTVEPVQDGARFVTLERVASVQAAGAAYHVCAGPHPDSAALDVLASVLTDRPSGRLYEALVAGDLATGVFPAFFSTAEPGLFRVMARAREDQDVLKAHDEMIAILEGLAAAPITDEEVERAKAKLLKNIRLSLNDSGRIGIQLSESYAQGDWRLFFIQRDRLKEVTAADVQRVAEKYFVASNRTSGIFTPIEEPVRAEVPETPDVMSIVEGYTGTETIAAGEAFEPTPENIEKRTTRMDLEEGIRLALLPKETRGDQVVARFTFHFGTEESLKDHKTALGMLPGLMMRGTERLDYQALRDEIDRLQARINVGGGPGVFSGSITCERKNLDASIRLLGEILQSPGFPEEEFDILKKQSLARLEESLTDPMRLGFAALQRAVNPFPKGTYHYAPTIEEQIERTQAVTLPSLKELYERFYGASNAEIVLVGDFDPAEVQKTLLEVFGEWKSPSPYARVVRPYKELTAENATIHTPDKENAIVATAATMKIRDDDPAYPALEFANYILGQSAKSRLLNRLRHEGGLSYGAGSQLQADDQDEVGALMGFAICAPQNAREAQEAMREEIDEWIEKGITEAELEEGKQGFALTWEGNLANDEYIAGTLLSGLETGRTFEFDAAKMKKIQELSLEDISKVVQERLAETRRYELIAGDMDKAAAGE